MTDDFVYKHIKIFQGGSTGLVQQKNQSKRKVKTTKNQVLIAIKNTAKDSFCFDIVAIHSGIKFKFVEEDALFLQKEFGWKNLGVNIDLAQCPHENIENLARKFERYKLKYCFLIMTDIGDNVVQRTITKSNIDDSIGWQIETPKSNTSSGWSIYVGNHNKLRLKNREEFKKTDNTQYKNFVGKRVMHEKFGSGLVVSVEGNKATVSFDNHQGYNTIIISFLELI